MLGLIVLSDERGMKNELQENALFYQNNYRQKGASLRSWFSKCYWYSVHLFFTWGGASIFKLLWVPDASKSQLSPFSGGLTLTDKSPLIQWWLVVYASHQSRGCPWPVTENCRGIKAQPTLLRPSNLSVAMHPPQLSTGSGRDWTSVETFLPSSFSSCPILLLSVP